MCACAWRPARTRIANWCTLHAGARCTMQLCRGAGQLRLQPRLGSAPPPLRLRRRPDGAAWPVAFKHDSRQEELAVGPRAPCDTVRAAFEQLTAAKTQVGGCAGRQGGLRQLLRSSRAMAADRRASLTLLTAHTLCWPARTHAHTACTGCSCGGGCTGPHARRPSTAPARSSRAPCCSATP